MANGTTPFTLNVQVIHGRVLSEVPGIRNSDFFGLGIVWFEHIISVS